MGVMELTNQKWTISFFLMKTKWVNKNQMDGTVNQLKKNDFFFTTGGLSHI